MADWRALSLFRRALSFSADARDRTLRRMFEYLQRKWNALGAITRAGEIGRLTVDEVEANLGELIVLDANPRFIFDKEHLPGARHVEYDAFTESDLPRDRDAVLLFYCHNGL